MTTLRILYGAWLLIITVVTAVTYAHDKRAARRRARRVPERTLFLLNIGGGVIGAWLIFFSMRHKTRHLSFWAVQTACSLLHLGLAWLLVVWL
ncbi:MAG: DUF1294 domain-containing protein [Oscillochloris sp.]|nr:DUF1294 domain-containing protein [Oscillochloris sp.]